LQVMFAGWGPMADLFYGALVLLLVNPETHRLLTKEIRESFSIYKDIIPGPTLTSLSYLHACIEETLRMLPSNLTGLPRVSPGATVDGQYIPKGVSNHLVPVMAYLKLSNLLILQTTESRAVLPVGSGA